MGGDGLYRYIIFKENNILNVGSITCSFVKPTIITFPGNQQISLNNNDLIISNQTSSKSIQLRTKNATNTGDNTLIYNTNGDLSGINNLTVATNLTTPKIQFTGTDATIYRSGLDVIINNITTGGLKINGYRSDGTLTQVSIDQFGNIGGVNDIFLNVINLRTSSNTQSTYIQKSTNKELIIDNREAGSQIYFRNYDNSNVMRQITIDSIMNMTGINDLYVQRIFLNNVQFNPSSVSTLTTKTTQIEYVAETPIYTPHTRFTVATNQGIYIIPKIQAGKNLWGGSIQTGDNCLVSDGGNMTLTTTSLTKNGMRISQTQTEIYNAKVDENGIKFNDDTIQTTAITQTILNSMINSAIQNAINQVIPVGTILSYGGAGSHVNGTLPTGYLWCIGALVEQATYPNLYNVIGHAYLYGREVQAGKFYLPDLKGAYLKGIGYNSRFTYQTSSTTFGEIQQCNVGAHAHTYKDRGSGERNDITTAGTSKAAKATDSNFWTDGATYDVYTHDPLESETRPNSVCINYIIKF